MTAEVFLDSNILLYACSAAADDAEKRVIAENLILETNFAFSTQVIQEFTANALRKKTLGISENGIDAMLELSTQVPVLPITRELLVSANTLRRQFQISNWDASIIAAGLELGCHTLYSEDLNSGQVYSGIRVINPFQ